MKRLRVIRTIDNVAVSKLSSINSNFVEIYLICDKDVEDESITKLIGNNRQLRKIQLIFPFEESFNSTMTVLQRNFQDGWTIESGKDYIIINREKIV